MNPKGNFNRILSNSESELRKCSLLHKDKKKKKCAKLKKKLIR